MTDNTPTPRQSSEIAKEEVQTASSPAEAIESVRGKQDACSNDRGGLKGWWQTVQQCWHDQDPDLTPRERLKGWWECIQHRWRLLAVVVLVISSVITGLVIVIGLYSDLTGRPAQELVFKPTPTPLPPTATPFTTPAGESEYLIIVTHFKDESEARNLDVRTVLAKGIKKELPAGLNARVAIGHNATPADEPEARAIGERYRATIILWGRYTDNLIEVNFTPLVELDTPTQTQEHKIISQTVDELAVFVNDLADGPVRWLSLLTVGQASHLAGRSEDAISCFSVALALLGTMEPDQRQVTATHFYRGTAYVKGAEYDRAIGDFDQAIELQPDDAIAYNNRGLAYYYKGEYDRAIEDYDQVIELKPDYATAYNNRGLAYADKREYDRAIEDFDQAIELKPDYATAYSNRGLAYRIKGEYDRAIEDFDQAIELKLDFAEAYSNRGNAYYYKGEYDRAIEDFDQAIELKPDYAEAYINRGLSYHNKGEYDRAIEDFDQAIELKPDFAEAYSNRGSAYYYKGEYDRAIEDYDQAIELQPDYAEAYTNRGGAYHNKGEYDRGIEDFDQAIELQPDYATAYNNRGSAYYYKGEYDRAIGNFDQAIELRPDYAKAYNNRGLAYTDKGEYDKAIEDFRKVVEVSDNPVLRQFAEVLLRELGASP